METEDEQQQALNAAQLLKARPALKTDEWACSDAKCAFINNDKRNTCQACGKTKPRSKNRVGREIGKEAAEKSKGLFSAEDWVCTKCGNVNWARRTMCNICNAPKLADLEVRTGYGGGYMDREEVEYIRRNDDDELFDEFGRKKKRRKRDEQEETAPITSEHHEKEFVVAETEKGEEQEKVEVELELELELEQPTDLIIKKEDDEEQEDEDESEDEGDDSKYDLTADLDLEDFKANIEMLRQKAALEQPQNGRPDTECSCSCSGGECSCIESEDEDAEIKRVRNDAENGANKQDIIGDSSDNQQLEVKGAENIIVTKEKEKKKEERSHHHHHRDKSSERSEKERPRKRSSRSPVANDRDKDRDRDSKHRRERDHKHDRGERDRKRSRDR